MTIRKALDPEGPEPPQADEDTHVQRFVGTADRGRPARPYLALLTGPETGKLILLQGRVTLGRGTTADLSFADSGLSREHLRFSECDGEVEVVDLGSRNGTSVNGHRIDRCELYDGDTVEAGNQTLVRVLFIVDRKEGLAQTDVDPDTGLFSSEYLHQELATLLDDADADQSTLAVIFFHFRADDEAALEPATVAAAARGARSAIRRHETCARINRDTLVLLCPGLPRETAERIAGRISTRVREALRERASGQAASAYCRGLHLKISRPTTAEAILERGIQLLADAVAAGDSTPQISAWAPR